jgi:hypothetical protein
LTEDDELTTSFTSAIWNLYIFGRIKIVCTGPAAMPIFAKLRDGGIEGRKDKINKLKEIEFLQFLNS